MTLNPNSVPPMPDPYNPSTTDSAFASWCAAIAHLAGRTQLGAEIGRTALKAKLYELRAGTTALIPITQTPIFESTGSPAVTQGPWLDPNVSQVIPAYGDQMQVAQQAEPAPTCPACGEPHHPEQDHPVAAPTPQYTSRCQFIVEFHSGNEKYTQPCDQPCYLGQDGVWHHLQPSGFHNAVPRPQDDPAPSGAS